MSAGPPVAYRVGLWTGRRVLVSDVDGTLLDGSAPGEGAAELGRRLVAANAALVLSSGRDLDLALEAAETLTRGGLPRPSGLVCGVGSEVYAWQGGDYAADDAWAGKLAGSGFDAGAVRQALAGTPHLSLQPLRAQGEFKVSYFVDDPAVGAQAAGSAAGALSSAGVPARVVYSAGRYLDVLPEPASKGGALLHLVERYALAPRDVVAAGDSGNDREMLVTAADAGMVAVLVANHEPEMEDLRGRSGVLLARGRHCVGVSEGLELAGW